MEKLKRIILMRDISMLNKLIISFLLLFTIPVSIIGIISYENYSSSIENTTTAYVSQLSTEVIDKLDTTFSDLYGTTIIPLYLPDMQDFLDNNDSYIQKSSNLKPYLNIINTNNNGQYSTYFFDKSGNVFTNSYANGEYSRKDTDSFFKEVQDKAEKAQGSSVLLGPDKITDIMGQPKYVLTIARSILNTKVPTYKSVGLIAIDVNLKMFDNTIQNIDKVTKGKTLIIDEKNKIIYGSDFTQVNRTYDEGEVLSKATGQSGSFILQSQDTECMFIYASMPKTGWKMFVRIPTSVLYEDAVKNSSMVVIVSLVAGVIAILLYMAIAITFTKPLRKLSRLMKRVQKGDMDVYFDVKYNDEVGLVATSFNNMIKQIKDLIDEIYLTKLRKQQAELDVLQGQINPHFIYNTMETIRMLSVLNGVNELAEISSTFGSMLRYSVNRGQETVTVRDELNHLEKYVYLQNKRFLDKFVLTIDIPEHYMDMQTIKLLFQPLVENSILHGLEKKKGVGNIAITLEDTAEFLFFRIKDDGIGIEPEILRQITMRLEDANVLSDDKTHIGLKNVNERIKLSYGEKYGLTVNSQEGSYTEVILRLPPVEKGCIKNA